MSISIDWPNRVITIPQADLIHISGTLYELDTDAFRLALKTLEASEGIVYPDTHRHNTTVTVAGVTFARTIEIINSYKVEFEDGAYSVRLAGSNNNLFDIEGGILVQNGVQVIPGNSAGLVVVSGGGGSDFPTPAEVAEAVWAENLTSYDPATAAGELKNKAEPADVPTASENAAATAAAIDIPTPAEIAAAVDAPTAQEVATQVWDLGDGVELALTPRQAMRLIAAASAGKLSGAEGTEIRIRDLADSTDRIIATVDESGNRLAVVTDVT